MIFFAGLPMKNVVHTTQQSAMLRTPPWQCRVRYVISGVIVVHLSLKPNKPEGPSGGCLLWENSVLFMLYLKTLLGRRPRNCVQPALFFPACTFFQLEAQTTPPPWVGGGVSGSHRAFQCSQKQFWGWCLAAAAADVDPGLVGGDAQGGGEPLFVAPSHPLLFATPLSGIWGYDPTTKTSSLNIDETQSDSFLFLGRHRGGGGCLRTGSRLLDDIFGM